MTSGPTSIPDPPEHERHVAHQAAAAHSSGHHSGCGHEEHHEGAPEWLISFADNTALMMGFFVIMLALTMAVKPQGQSTAENSAEKSEAAETSGQSVQQLDFALSVREAFHNPVTVNSTNPRDRYLVMRLREKLAGENPVPEETVDGKSDFSQSLDRGLLDVRVARIIFENGSDQLSTDAEPTIESFANRACGLRQVVEVRGHISALESAAQPDHGLLLSYQRAYAVAERLYRHGLAWNQMRLVAAGSAEPMDNRAYTVVESTVNCRVEITLTEQLMSSESVGASRP